MAPAWFADPLRGRAAPQARGAAAAHPGPTGAAEGMPPALAGAGAVPADLTRYEPATAPGLTQAVAVAPGAGGPGAASLMSYYAASLPTPAPDANADAGPLTAAGPDAAGASQPEGAPVHALFRLGTPQGGPSPSGRFTVADHTQDTNRRVNLPLPDPVAHQSDYEDTQVLNTLDGFNLQPRLSVPFDGSIDVHSVSSQTMFLVSLGDTLGHHDHGGQVVGINQVVWDTFTDTLHVQSDQFLDQHTRYAFIVTNGIHDEQGHAVAASREFRHFRQDLDHSHDPVLRFYGEELEDAVRAARHVGVPERDIVDASVFSTQSVTAVMEKIRDQIKAGTPAPADFNLGQNGERTVFNRADVTGIHWEEQTGDNPLTFTPVDLDQQLRLLNVIPGAVGLIAFGKYVSPDYEVHPGEYIPPVGTRTGTPEVRGYNEIYFNLFLPSGTMPADGWPVAIFGHGALGNKNDQPFNVASTMAAHGIATIAINETGFGFGPLGTLTVRQTGGGTVTFPAGGRGIDQDDDHTISSGEGNRATPPRTIISDRDGRRQTVADLMQLVRVIEVGMDVAGNGSRDLDPSRIYYFGQAVAAMYGTTLLTIDPSVRAGVLNNAAGPQIDNQRLGSNRGNIGTSLAARTPPLVNSPGIVTIGGIPAGVHPFNENMPLRDGTPLAVSLADGTSYYIRSPVINTVQGAMEIQEAVDQAAWVTQSGDPIPYAPHIRLHPLPGVPAKSVIFQFAKGDQVAPNPATSRILRAGDLADRTTFFRNDLAYADDHAVPKNPHRFMVDIDIPALTRIGLGAQRQIAAFFASDGQFTDDLSDVTTRDGTPLFEVPVVGPLPEDLNYIP
jgi:hypothetical protein